MVARRLNRRQPGGLAADAAPCSPAGFRHTAPEALLNPGDVSHGDAPPCESAGFRHPHPRAGSRRGPGRRVLPRGPFELGRPPPGRPLSAHRRAPSGQAGHPRARAPGLRGPGSQPLGDQDPDDDRHEAVRAGIGDAFGEPPPCDLPRAAGPADRLDRRGQQPKDGGQAGVGRLFRVGRWTAVLPVGRRPRRGGGGADRR